MRFSTPKETSGFKPKEFLYVGKGYWQFIDSYFKSVIDCGENRDIFQGLIAMDDNSIADQWLTNGEKWLMIKCSDYSAIFSINKVGMLERLLNENYHKATPEEIILKNHNLIIQLESIREIDRLKFILEKENLIRSGDKILDSKGEEYTLCETLIGKKIEKVQKPTDWSGRELKEVENMCEKLKCDNMEISYSLEGEKIVSCRLQSHDPKIEGKNKGIYFIPKNCPHCLSKHRDWEESSSSRFIPYQDLDPTWYGFKHFNKK